VTHRLPRRSVDMTMHSGWATPEIYLDSEYRQSMSGFALAPVEDVEPGVALLGEELRSGAWERRFGHWRSRESADMGMRFIYAGTR
jgi:hypothetical protein